MCRLFGFSVKSKMYGDSSKENQKYHSHVNDINVINIRQVIHAIDKVLESGIFSILKAK